MMKHLDLMLRHHLQFNLFPKIDEIDEWVVPCFSAISLMDEGKPDAFVELPRPVLWSSVDRVWTTAVPAYELVERYHLDGFLNYKEQ